MRKAEHDEGLNFGHQFHGREHHFLVTRDALQFLEGSGTLDEIGQASAYNKHLGRIHAVAEQLSQNADPQVRIVLSRALFE